MGDIKKLALEELGRPALKDYVVAPKHRIVVVIDQVRSMNNIGSIFRTCDAFGLEGIVLCGISACPPHREIHKTALGSEESVSWSYVEKTQDALRELKQKDYTIIGLEQTNQSIPLHRGNWQKDTAYALVLGNEVEGISEEALPLCDQVVEIPQFGTKHSLNVSVAAGVALWHLIQKLYLT